MYAINVGHDVGTTAINSNQHEAEGRDRTIRAFKKRSDAEE